jgi:Glyoxalase-like domain
MTCELTALCVEALDPARVGRFWGSLLGGSLASPSDAGVVVSLPGETGFMLHLVPTVRQKTEQNLMHFDLTSLSPKAQQATVDRALRLGAQPANVGQRGDEPHVVLADVEGNEFCVIEAGNAFLADCGFIGALACDGSRTVGAFWAAALGWPLVWDRGEETAIQAPHGGPKITWGGPPLMPRNDGDRLFFEVGPTSGSDRDTEIDRLLSLGATRRSGRAPEADGVDMSDPDGNLFRVLARSSYGLSATPG